MNSSLFLLFVLFTLSSYNVIATAVPAVVTTAAPVSTDGGILTIFGNNLKANAANIITVTLGTATNCPVTQSDASHIVCTVPKGAGSMFLSTITEKTPSNTLVQTTNFNFSYIAPSITTVLPHTGLSEGDFITIAGDNFGNVDGDVFIITIGGLECTTPRVLHGLGVIICEAPNGIGSQTLTMCIGPAGHTNCLTWGTKMGFQNLSPKAFACPGATTTFSPPDTDGGQTLQICGRYLGLPDAGWEGNFAVTVGNLPCVITDQSWTNISCTIPSGAGKVSVAITINGFQVPPAFYVQWPDARPTGTNPSTFNKKTKRDASSSSVATTFPITIYGQNFGPNAPYYNSRRNINFGTFPCNNVQWVSNGVLVCQLPTTISGANIAISMSVAGTPNNPYAGPVLDTNVPAGGGGGSGGSGGGGGSSVPGCNFPQGASDITTPSLCNCFSGYAPSDETGTDCAVKAHCPGQILAKGTAGGATPSRPKSSFANDHLTITQTSPIVFGRRDFRINFQSPNNSAIDTCNYPGPIWTKTVSTLDCFDVFTFTLPWSQNGICGFSVVSGSPAQYVTYRSTMSTVYREVFTNTQLQTLSYRSSTVTHYVTVKFQRQLTVAVSSVNIAGAASASSEIDIVIVEDALFDPATSLTFVTFDTTANSPFQIADNMAAFWTPSADNNVPAGADAVLTLALLNPQPGDVMCGDVDEACSQRWVLQIKTVNGGVSLCNLKGRIDFEPTLLCREGGPAVACPSGVSAPANISVTFSTDTQLCDSPSDDIDAAAQMSFAMTSYEDTDFSMPQSTFQPSEVAHFQIAVVDPQGTIDGITITDVTLLTSVGSDHLYTADAATGVVSAYEPLSKFNISNQLVKGRDAPLPPNSVGTVSFYFTLSRSLSPIVPLLADPSIDIGVQAICEITYHGNQKRSVLVAGPLQQTASLRITLISSGADAEAAATGAEVQDDYAFSPSGAASLSIAPLFTVLAVVVLTLFAL